MGLDETSQIVWQTKDTPLLTFVASRLTLMAAVGLPAGARDEFCAFSEMVVSWWPGLERTPRQVHEQEFSACLELYNQPGNAGKMELAMTGVYLQMAGLLDHLPRRSLPHDRYDRLRAADFALWLREVAKIGRLPLAQVEARLKLFLDHRKSWTDLNASAGRMRWGRSNKWSKLPKRVRPLASLVDLGATRTWVSMDGQKLMQFQLEGAKRISNLDPEELAALDDLFPNTDP